MKLRSIAVVMAAIMLFVFSGMVMAADKAADRSWPESVDKYVGNAKKSVKVIDMAAFKKIVENKGDAVIIDVRDSDEYKGGYVPGAINISRGTLEFKVWKAVAGYPAKTDLKKKIYIYCALGGRSALAAKALKDLGFTDVTAVDMKFADWIKAGNKVQR